MNALVPFPLGPLPSTQDFFCFPPEPANGTGISLNELGA